MSSQDHRRTFKDLEALALHLAKNGPVKTLSTPRRVRILYKGACLADTLGTPDALFVWEHDYYPQLYLPKDAFLEPPGYDTMYSEKGTIKNSQGRKIASEMEITVRHADDPSDKPSSILHSVIEFSDELDAPAKGLEGMVKVYFDAVDEWLEEDTPIFVHPKDPFKRVDILTSTRPIRIAVDGRTIAETSVSMHLYETNLPVRFYMPLTSINTSVLRPSTTRTQCPYKGESEYHSVVVNGKEYRDIVWFYSRPTIECAAIAGMRCFYNEKVDISVLQGDGEWELLERPNSHFD